jgi:hypothetical protein
MARTSREIWRERVRQWQASGQTAERFAARHGFKAGTLRHWKWLLGAERRGWKARRKKAAPPFVEIVRAADLVGHGAQPEPFELLLGNAIRIRIPVRFDPASLLLLVNALEGR